jgi:rubrerythrin
LIGLREHLHVERALREGSLVLLNHYQCPECKHEWTDRWTGEADEHCPACGAEDISPVKSERIFTGHTHEGDEYP